MYFLFLLIICSTSILLTPVNTYVVVAGKLNDFRNLAKKYGPKNLVGQLKAMAVENGHIYYKEPYKDDEEVDGTDEYEDESQQDDSYEVAKRIKQLPGPKYQLKSAKKVVATEPKAMVTKPTVLTIDDIVERVKQRLFKQVLDESAKARNQAYTNAQKNAKALTLEDSLAYKYFPKKPLKATEANVQVKTPIYKSVPMKVIKEEVQFEATYEDTLDKDMKPQIQYPGLYLQSKLEADNSNTNYVAPKNNRVVNTQPTAGVKKIRFIKQVLVPADQTAYIPQPSLVQQPTLQPTFGQQPNIVHANLEPQLSLMQLPSKVQKPINQQLQYPSNIHQSNIIKQLDLLKQQIEQVNRTVQQRDLKNKPSGTVLGEQPLNIEAVEGHFEIVPNQAVQKTNDGNGDQVEPSNEEAEEGIQSEETTVSSVTKNSKALTGRGKVDNEQIEENEVVQDAAGSAEIDDEAVKETKESLSNEDGDKQDTEIIEEEVKNTKLSGSLKIHTQEFGNTDAGEPIVAKTYNFDKPSVEVGPVSYLKLPVDSARKVMLF